MKWRQLLGKSTLVPEARSSHSISSIGNALFVFGGEHEPRVPMNSDVWKYDLKKEDWERITASGNPPMPRVAHSAAAVDQKLYIFGGRVGIGMDEGSLNDMYVFDTHTHTWSQIHTHDSAHTHVPQPRSYHQMCVVDKDVYLFGGCGKEGRLNDLWLFDTHTHTWKQMPSAECIKGRGGAGVAAANGCVYVCGGFSGMEMGDVHIFDTRTHTWVCGCVKDAQTGTYTSKNTIPARSVYAIDTHTRDGKMYAFGGEVDPSTQGHEGAGEYSSETLSIRTEKDTHTLVCEKVVCDTTPEARGWHTGCMTPLGLVVHGGNSLKNERLADMWLLELD